MAEIHKKSSTREEFVESIGTILTSCFKDPSIHKEEVDGFKEAVLKDFNKFVFERATMGVFYKILDTISKIWGGDIESVFIDKLTTKSKEILGKYTKDVIQERGQQASVTQER